MIFQSPTASTLRSLNHLHQVSKRWNLVVKCSLLLEYLIELGIEDYIDGSSTHFTLKERRRALREHQRAWRYLEPTDTVKIIRDTKHLYEASGSIFAWGTGEEPSLLSFYQASSDIFNRPSRQWELKHLGTSFRDFAMSQEEDLLVLIEETERYVIPQLQGDVSDHLYPRL